MREIKYLFYLICLCKVYECQITNSLLDNFQAIITDDSYFLTKSGFIRHKTYDFIIIGAGSAGSVLANRLSENKNWNILLLEAGVYENFLSDVPIMAASQTLTKYNWGFDSEISNVSCLSLKNNRCTVPRGKAIGGTSVINFLIYTRGNKLDFDEWEKLGNKGWSYRDVLPYFKKSENCSLLEKIDLDYRGTNGNLHIQHSPFNTPILDKFLKAGVELGFNVTDPNGPFHVGFSQVQATMINGRRQSTGKAYIKPIRERSNLDIITSAHVVKILINEQTNEAQGVLFIKDSKIYTVRANKEVILSAGAINSPQILMLSGIGPKEDLERLEIPVIQDLRVGYNLQDHVSYVSTFLINETVTVSDLRIQNPINVFNYFFNGKGPMTIPGGAEGLAFIKSKLSVNEDSNYPDLELVLGAGGFNNDFYGTLRSVYGLSDALFYNLYGSVLLNPAFSISTVLLKPRSKGRVVIKDSNPLRQPAIHLNYFKDELDTQVMIEGLKMAKLIGESEPLKRFAAQLLYLKLPKCKNSKIDTDEYLACLVKNLATTLGHHVGTCKMGPNNDKEAVVDSQLLVYGIKKLRVVDGSIMPTIVTGHTNSVIVMIAEKAADIIKSYWKDL